MKLTQLANRNIMFTQAMTWQGNDVNLNLGLILVILTKNFDTDIISFQRLFETYRQYDFNFCLSGHHKPQTKDVLSRMEAALPEAWRKQHDGGRINNNE